jgi:hypothetical protein
MRADSTDGQIENYRSHQRFHPGRHALMASKVKIQNMATL